MNVKSHDHRNHRIFCSVLNPAGLPRMVTVWINPLRDGVEGESILTTDIGTLCSEQPDGLAQAWGLQWGINYLNEHVLPPD